MIRSRTQEQASPLPCRNRRNSATACKFSGDSRGEEHYKLYHRTRLRAADKGLIFIVLPQATPDWMAMAPFERARLHRPMKNSVSTRFEEAQS